MNWWPFILLVVFVLLFVVIYSIFYWLVNAPSPF